MRPDSLYPPTLDPAHNSPPAHESLRQAAIVESSDGTIIAWSREAQELYGYNEAEAVGSSIHMLSPTDDAPQTRAVLEEVCETHRDQHYQAVRLRKDGRPVRVSVQIHATDGPDGLVVEASVMAGE